ncbi:MAG: adenylate/guanylate cyclase domain-containing protein [Rhodoferax sp.]|nr:adenylate/guanylate cyclase domain-containing protein [Rhodoferax sp.]
MGIQSTVVFTDLHGSTAVFGALGNALATETVTGITSWITQVAKAFGCHFVKTLGDGVMVAFHDRHQALGFVVDVQRGHEHNEHGWTDEVPIPIRIGIAAGEVEAHRGDYFGDAVNVAARLCDLCGPNQIWASDTVMDPVHPWDHVKTRALGAIDIRGRPHPCNVLQIEWREEEPSELLTMQGASPEDADPTRDALGKEIRLEYDGHHTVFRSYELPVHIGRIKSAQFVVPDARVSRSHAQLIWRNGGVILADLSTYGTWVRFADDPTSHILLRRDECILHGRGWLALGASFAEPTMPCIQFAIR